MKLGIFGLGYVGTVSLGGLASLGHRVIGTDVHAGKVSRIRQGKSPVSEPGLERLLRQGLSSGNIEVTLDPAEVVSRSEISFICVGTPDQTTGRMDLSQVDRVCRDIGGHLARGPDYPVIALRSTVLPGVTDAHVTPLLEKFSGLRPGEDFGVCFHPEFLREGTAVQDFLAPPFSVIGCGDERTARVVSGLYPGLKGGVRTVPARSAEMLKYACNVFHALKIAFANEIGALCEREKIDGRDLMDLFCEDRELNISKRYLRPGFAFGGSCLPKDVRVLLRHARESGLDVPLLEAVLPSNETHLARSLEKIQAAGSRRVGILGLSFKAGTDDLRESPGVLLASRLLSEGYDVTLFDPNIEGDDLEGQNLAFATRMIPQFADRLASSIEALLQESEVVVITTREEAFRRKLPGLPPGRILIDLTSGCRNHPAEN